MSLLSWHFLIPKIWIVKAENTSLQQAVAYKCRFFYAGFYCTSTGPFGTYFLLRPLIPLIYYLWDIIYDYTSIYYDITFNIGLIFKFFPEAQQCFRVAIARLQGLDPWVRGWMKMARLYLIFSWSLIALTVRKAAHSKSLDHCQLEN